MKLNKLKDCEGANRLRVRVGRGVGSGCGKTACRGVKGQKSRSGVRIKGFEGGQMPIYRRLPKRGFRSLHPNKYSTIRLEQIQILIDKGIVDSKAPKIDYELCVQNGLVKRSQKGMRIVCGGELKTPVIIEACGVSSSARSIIEKLGGKILLPNV